MKKKRLIISIVGQIIEMRVHMDCAGCESKVRKTLQKMKGIYIYKQKVNEPWFCHISISSLYLMSKTGCCLC